MTVSLDQKDNFLGTEDSNRIDIDNKAGLGVVFKSQFHDYSDFVCKSYDEYLENNDKAIWMVELSNGEHIYQDDDRPGYEPIAWFRLKNYCTKNNLSIIRLFIKFRSHIELNDENQEGYFYRRKAFGGTGMGRTDHYFVLGSVKDGKIHCKHWKLPEVIMDEEDIRDIDSENEGQIIWNPQQQKVT